MITDFLYCMSLTWWWRRHDGSQVVDSGLARGLSHRLAVPRCVVYRPSVWWLAAIRSSMFGSQRNLKDSERGG